MRSEVLGLLRELRARAERMEESDWTALSAPPPAPVPLASLGDGVLADTGSGYAGLFTAPPAAPLASREERAPAQAGTMAGLAARVEACRRCPLGEQRLHPAFGVGSTSAEVMFIGEGPGYEEDRIGVPFVGKAGQLLDKILAAIGLSRETVYIANIVKCHPMVDPSAPEKRGNDRPPSAEEMAACREYLEAQIALIRPRFLVTLGGVASKTLIGTETGIMGLRGKWHRYTPLDIPLMPTFHPAALLRNPEWKRDVWMDMKKLKRALEDSDEDLT